MGSGYFDMEPKCPLLEGLTVQSLYEKISVWEINVIKGKWISFINIDATHSNNGITYLQILIWKTYK